MQKRRPVKTERLLLIAWSKSPYISLASKSGMVNAMSGS